MAQGQLQRAAGLFELRTKKPAQCALASSQLIDFLIEVGEDVQPNILGIAIEAVE